MLSPLTPAMCPNTCSLLSQGDFKGARGGSEGLENDPLFSPVSYGPEPQTLGSQPVFSFSTIAAALWFSKIVYCDGVVPNVKVEVRGLDCCSFLFVY